MYSSGVSENTSLTRAVVFNLFCSIAPLQELCFKIAPHYDFRVAKYIISF